VTEVQADTAVAGLTAQEAARRLAADGPNELPSERPRNLWQQTWDVIREPMIVLLLAAGLVNFLLAKPLDAIMLMGGVVVVISADNRMPGTS
jgi:Ca2+-transporting ATPase